MNTCACGTSHSTDAYLCSTCTSTLRTVLGKLPTLVADLELTMSKQRRFGDPIGGSRATTQTLPFNLAAAAVLHELRYELASLVRLCLTSNLHSGAQPEAQPPAMSAWLLARVDAIAGQPWAADTLRLHRIAARGEYVIDAPPDRTYAGPCNDCGTDLYAAAGHQQVTCHDCGITYDLAARRQWLLKLVDDRLATATEIARALTSLELPITAERIRQWKHRGRLKPRASDHLDRPRFRVGDVVNLLAEYADKAS